MFSALMWSHRSRPQTVMHILSVQTNQQYDKPSAFENRRSPLAQWNVQAMEIWKNLLDPHSLSAQWIYKEQQSWLCTWHMPMHVTNTVRSTTPVFLYFALTKACGLWGLYSNKRLIEVDFFVLSSFDRSISPVLWWMASLGAFPA